MLIFIINYLPSLPLLFQCSAYKAGNVSGPLCSDLCERNNIHLGQCLSSVPEKKIYDGHWGGNQVILKVNMSWFEEFEKREKVIDNDAMASYTNDVSSRVRTLFGDCPRCSELTSLLLSLGDGDDDGTVTISETRTFISLLQQMEPMMMMTLNESKHTVDFYGYCGGLYVLEKVPFIASKMFLDTWELLDLSFLPDAFEPLQDTINHYGGKILNVATYSVQYSSAILNNYLDLTGCSIFRAVFPVHVTSKRERFDVAYSMLDAILDVSDNPYGLVQSCDGHLGNYGITKNSFVKIIDLDETYPHVFLKTRLEQKNCKSDSDCWIGISEVCCSTCNRSTGHCTSQFQYQDLHVVCEDIFHDIFRDPNIPEPQGYNNTTYLTKAIRKLGVFCSKLPVVYSVEELKRDIQTVKKRLRSIEIRSTGNCSD